MQLETVAARHKTPHPRQPADEELHAAMLAVASFSPDLQGLLQPGGVQAPQVPTMASCFGPEQASASDENDDGDIMYE